MKKLFLSLFVFSTLVTFSQQIGVVVDSKGEPINDVDVFKTHPFSSFADMCCAWSVLGLFSSVYSVWKAIKRRTPQFGPTT